MVLHWSLTPFAQLYASIQQERCDVALFKTLKDDLIKLTRTPAKSTTSRSELEKPNVKFSDGLSYELNDSFKIAAATLSDELNIDELVAAEILFEAEGTGNGLLDSAKAIYYLRKQHILSIISYIFNCGDQVLLKEVWSEKFVDDLMESFKFVHEELKSIHQLVARARLVGNYNASDFQLKLTFRRDFLNSQHELLGEILYGLVSQNLISRSNFVRFVDFTASFDVDDFFITHLIPALFLFCSQLDKLKEEDVKLLHSELLKSLKSADIYQQPAKLIVILVFLTYFINWCKASPQRVNTFDFEIAIETPMTSAVQLGAIEQLLIICAETSDNDFELFYDLRSLLEQHLPRLVPKRILDINEEESKRVRSQDSQAAPIYIVTKAHTLSENMSALLTQMVHNFVQCFIFDAAFLLIKIKDSEEDSLLSGEDSLLDDISKKADLERFYLAIYYLYAERQELISTFWEDRESNSYGFIEWASKGEDLLMRSTFLVMLSALTKGEENANHVYHFIANSDKISWSMIINILDSYIDQIFKFETGGDDKDLNEETILSISSYLTLVYKVADNCSATIEIFDSSLLDTLFNFVKLDTPLVGAVLHVLRSLISDGVDSIDRRNTIWEKLDQWLFAQDLSIEECFQSRLIAFPDILGFVDLLEGLLRPRNTFGKFTLPYPQNLGYPHRKPGITPYLEFLLSNVFFHSPSLYFAEKVALQYPILKIVEHCLSSFDSKMILNSFPASVDLNKVVSTGEFTTYVQANPAPMILNFLFQEKIYTTLLDITSTGFDNISDKPFEEKQVQVVDLSLQIIDKILSLEVTFIDELLPILKKDNRFYTPSRMGTHGLRSFYDAVLFNLPVIAHIALYVGSSHLPIADKSIKLLTRFSKSPQFGSSNPNSVGKTKLLTIMDSINESLRIKINFINQLESEITSEENLALKIQILNFLNMNLSVSSRKTTISHFLLGFDFTNGLSLGSSSSSSTIASGTSLFKTLLYILESSFLSINSSNIDYAPIRLASLCLEIILKLSRNPLSSTIILPYLSDQGLLNKLLETPRVDQLVLWNSQRFDPTISQKTSFNDGPAMGAFLSLLNQRSFILQYLSLELHRTSSEGSIAKTNQYIDALIDGYGVFAGPPKVLSFLDVLELSLDDVSTIPEDDLSIFANVDLTVDLSKIPLNIDCNSFTFDLDDVDSLLDLHLRWLWTQGMYKTDQQAKEKEQEIETLKTELKRADSRLTTSLIPLPVTVQSNESESLEEISSIKTKFSNYLAYSKFKSFQLASLHSWVQLIQVIVTDGKMDPIKRSNFILEVFQSIIPRINDYVEQDILYAEELVSLCVSLYDIYHQDRKLTEDGNSNAVDAYERLYPLFKTAMHGILSPSSSLTLRSDLYVLGNKYLSWVLKHKDTSKEILQSIKLSSDRLITVICNDAIGGEGPTRITGLLLLESLFQLSNMNQLNFVLNTLVKNNLLLLLVKSIKRTDETLLLSYESKISLDSLLYELTAFKATLSFLIRVAETRHGAQQLLQSEIFQTIKSCQFLLIDPDLGIELVFDESTVQSSTFVRVNLNLETPLSINSSSNGVSLFELLIPAFQLVSAILLSTSSENKPVIQQVKNLLKHFKKLIVGVLKRDMLVESKKEGAEIYKHEGVKGSSLKELVNLFVLLSTLTDFHPEE